MTGRLTDDQVAEALRGVPRLSDERVTRAILEAADRVQHDNHRWNDCADGCPTFPDRALLQVSADLSAAEEEHYECVRIASERLGRQLNPERTRDAVVALINALDESQADLAAAKERLEVLDKADESLRSAFNKAREEDAAALSALKKAAREADTAGRALVQRIDAEGGHGPKVHDLNSALFEKLIALRSLLPEEGR